MSNNGSGIETGLQVIKTDEICENISDNVIYITESKARLVYREYAEAPTKNAMLSDFGLAVAFATPLLTSDFKSILGLSSETIKAMFILIAIAFGAKFIVSAFKYFAKGKPMDEDRFLQDLKGDNHENR